MKKTIVVIDDSAITLEAIVITLRNNLSDYDIVGIQVRDAFPESIPEQVEVFFVDHNLGWLTGSDVVEKIRPKYPNARIVGWSNTSLKQIDVARFLGAGADITSIKPVDEKKIVKLVTEDPN